MASKGMTGRRDMRGEISRLPLLNQVRSTPDRPDRPAAIRSTDGHATACDVNADDLSVRGEDRRSRSAAGDVDVIVEKHAAAVLQQSAGVDLLQALVRM